MTNNRSARFLWSALALSAALLHARPAHAEGPTDQETFSVASNGQPAAVRKGFFAQTALGGFATFGGKAGYSNMEAFLALGVGIDFLSDFSFGLQFQLAPSAENCYAPDGTCSNATNANSGSKTFTMAALDAVLSYRIQLIERLYIPIRLFGGMANFSPLPVNNLACPSTNPNCAVVPPSAAGDIWEPTFGGATGIEYATGFEHFTISLEVSLRDLPFLGAAALSIYPQIKYTF
jgi:hypothetical protein